MPSELITFFINPYMSNVIYLFIVLHAVSYKAIGRALLREVAAILTRRMTNPTYDVL